MIVAAAEEMRDGNEDHGAERCGSERIPEAAAENSEFHEDPSTDERADESEDDVVMQPNPRPRAILPASQPAISPMKIQ